MFNSCTTRRRQMMEIYFPSNLKWKIFVRTFFQNFTSAKKQEKFDLFLLLFLLFLLSFLLGSSCSANIYIRIYFKRITFYVTQNMECKHRPHLKWDEEFLNFSSPTTGNDGFSACYKNLLNLRREMFALFTLKKLFMTCEKKFHISLVFFSPKKIRSKIENLRQSIF